MKWMRRWSTATALAREEIEVIAVWEQTTEYDGLMTSGNPVKQNFR